MHWLYHSGVPVALVTGANGFIGSHLCEALIARGWATRALVRRTSNLRWLSGVAVKQYFGDVSAPETLPDAVKAVDYVFHAAAIVKTRHAEEFTRVNCDGTRNLLDACAQRAPRLKKLVFLSTIAAAGPADQSCGPVSRYGESKLVAERIVAEFAARLAVAVLRLPAIYGPRDTESLGLIRALNSGIRPGLDMSMSVCYVVDAVEAAIALALSAGSDATPCSVCDGTAHDFQGWATRVEALLGRKTLKLRIPPWLLRRLAWWSEKLSAEMPIFNRDKARELSCRDWTCDLRTLQARTGFAPKYDLERGMRLTIDWYREHKWLR